MSCRSALKHALNKASAPKLMTGELVATLADHAQGNLRSLMNTAGEPFELAAEREARHIDEKLFLEAFAQPVPEKVARGLAAMRPFPVARRPGGSPKRPRSCAGSSPIYGPMMPLASSAETRAA
jgi:hypothetical protein